MCISSLSRRNISEVWSRHKAQGIGALRLEHTKACALSEVERRQKQSHAEEAA